MRAAAVALVVALLAWAPPASADSCVQSSAAPPLRVWVCEWAGPAVGAGAEGQGRAHAPYSSAPYALFVEAKAERGWESGEVRASGVAFLVVGPYGVLRGASVECKDHRGDRVPDACYVSGPVRSPTLP